MKGKKKRQKKNILTEKLWTVQNDGVFIKITRFINTYDVWNGRCTEGKKKPDSVSFARKAGFPRSLQMWFIKVLDVMETLSTNCDYWFIQSYMNKLTPNHKMLNLVRKIWLSTNYSNHNADWNRDLLFS